MILTLKSISAAQLPTPQGKLQDLGHGANLLQASVSHYLQCGPSSWSLESPAPWEESQVLLPFPVPWSSLGAAREPPPAARGRSQEIRAGRPPPARARRRRGRRRGRRLPPETRSRCARRGQHSWKVTQAGRGAGHGRSPLPDVHREQLPSANKVSSWLRRAAHSLPPPPARHPLPSFPGRPGGGAGTSPHPQWSREERSEPSGEGGGGQNHPAPAPQPTPPYRGRTEPHRWVGVRGLL